MRKGRPLLCLPVCPVVRIKHPESLQKPAQIVRLPRMDDIQVECGEVCAVGRTGYSPHNDEIHPMRKENSEDSQEVRFCSVHHATLELSAHFSGGLRFAAEELA